LVSQEFLVITALGIAYVILILISH
jgi:hypothetical protein